MPSSASSVATDLLWPLGSNSGLTRVLSLCQGPTCSSEVDPVSGVSLIIKGMRLFISDTVLTLYAACLLLQIQHNGFWLLLYAQSHKFKDPVASQETAGLQLLGFIRTESCAMLREQAWPTVFLGSVNWCPQQTVSASLWWPAWGGC